MIRLLRALAVLSALAPTVSAQVPDGVVNTQNPKDVPVTPAEALKKIRVPKGFEVTLFAGEPNVAQPASMCLDERGRVWVGEFYSYRNWKKTGTDRIVILDDKDGDGQF
ncbi:MAG: dehydrogenase, partial [Planctomycetota bacterium]